MTFGALALTALLVLWFACGFVCWLPWVALNGPDRPLTRLGAALAGGYAGALVLPAIGVRGETGLALSPLLALAGGTLASAALHTWLRRRRLHHGEGT